MLKVKTERGQPIALSFLAYGQRGSQNNVVTREGFRRKWLTTFWRSFTDAIHVEFRNDIRFVLSLAQEANGAVLEAGCGTGRLILPLAQAGLSVTGIDNSDAMLERAQQRVDQLQLERCVELVSADMTHFTLPKKDYALAIISHNTLMHLNVSEIRSMLRCIDMHLRPGGRLLIDIDNPFVVASAKDRPGFLLERMLEIPKVGEVMQFARWNNNRERQILRVEWRYVMEDGEIVSAETAYNYHYPHTLQMLMEKAGFLWREVYGDYDKEAFEEDSEKLLIVSEKRY